MVFGGTIPTENPSRSGCVGHNNRARKQNLVFVFVPPLGSPGLVTWTSSMVLPPENPHPFYPPFRPASTRLVSALQRPARYHSSAPPSPTGDPVETPSAPDAAIGEAYAGAPALPLMAARTGPAAPVRSLEPPFVHREIWNS